MVKEIAKDEHLNQKQLRIVARLALKTVWMLRKIEEIKNPTDIETGRSVNIWPVRYPGWQWWLALMPDMSTIVTEGKRNVSPWVIVETSATCNPCKINTGTDDVNEIEGPWTGWICRWWYGRPWVAWEAKEKRQTVNYRTWPEKTIDQASENVTPERSGSGRYYKWRM